MAKVKLSPEQSIQYYEDGRLVAVINSENIDRLSPVLRDYIAFIHPYDMRGVFTIPIIPEDQETDDFRVIGKIEEREKQGNTLVFKIRGVDGERKNVRIIYNEIDLDKMIEKSLSSQKGTTVWGLMLGGFYEFPRFEDRRDNETFEF